MIKSLTHFLLFLGYDCHCHNVGNCPRRCLKREPRRIATHLTCFLWLTRKPHSFLGDAHLLLHDDDDTIFSSLTHITMRTFATPRQAWTSNQPPMPQGLSRILLDFLASGPVCLNVNVELGLGGLRNIRVINYNASWLYRFWIIFYRFLRPRLSVILCPQVERAGNGGGYWLRCVGRRGYYLLIYLACLFDPICVFIAVIISYFWMSLPFSFFDCDDRGLSGSRTQPNRGK